MTAALIALAAASAGTPSAPPAAQLDAYDVVWRSPSRNATGSMPIGNGEVVLNVWVEEATGDLVFYIARTDSLSEISRLLKLGAVRVHMEPSPFVGAKDFVQRLRLRAGRIEVAGGGGKLGLFVDSAAHVVHMSGSFARPTRVTATAECWRNEARELPKGENGSAWSVHDAPFERVEAADIFEAGAPGRVSWYHRNETSIVPKLWQNQSLTGLPGTFDPLLGRTFGASMQGPGLVRRGERDLVTPHPVRSFGLQVATHTAQTGTVAEWRKGLAAQASNSEPAVAARRTQAWWRAYWRRSWVFISGDTSGPEIPSNTFPLRLGFDSNGQNRFAGQIQRPLCVARVLSEAEIAAHFAGPMDAVAPEPMIAGDAPGLTLAATIAPTGLTPGRILDKVTAASGDGFLFDTHPGDSLRLIVGSLTLTAPKCLTVGGRYDAAATYDARTGEASITLDGKRIAHREPEQGSAITRGYVLQRYVQACQNRGALPAKFNGGTYTVEPAAMGMPYNADFRNWGDCYWFQNVRHIVHPMPASGDSDMMDAFFRLYEAARPLAEGRTRLYHKAEGAYFPETMTFFGTYSGGDYGWDRAGREPSYVQCRYWANAWNQGPELLGLLLDSWDTTRSAAFLRSRVLPMAESVLRYFDTRFRKDAQGKVVIDPTQVVETYWDGVVNDLPTVAGLIAVTRRLCDLPASLVTQKQRAFFTHMRATCPDLPIETVDGERRLAPAQKYDPRTYNCENGELYAVWPFRLVSMNRPELLPEGRAAYAARKNHLPVGWGYDGNVAALLGLTDEATGILRTKAANSHPAYRWPATWGPNFDWLPDQNHGGNLLNTTHLMLMQAEPIEAGGAIRLLPAWPRAWDVSFKLHAPGKTVVECVYRRGRVESLKVTPPERAKDIVMDEAR
jgi:hypothetical protein